MYDLSALLKLPPTPTLWTLIVRTAHTMHEAAPGSVDKHREALEAAFASWPVGLRFVPREWVGPADAWTWDHPLLWMTDRLQIRGLYPAVNNKPAIDLAEMVASPGLATIAVIDVLDTKYGAEELGVLLDSKLPAFEHLLGLQLNADDLAFVLGHSRALKGLGFDEPIAGAENWGLTTLTEWEGLKKLERIELRYLQEFGAHIKEFCSKLESVRHFALNYSKPTEDTFSMAGVDVSANEFATEEAIASIPNFRERLEHLQLHNNGLRSLSLMGSKGMKRLHTLSIDTNPLGPNALRFLNAKDFPALQNLRASRCELTGNIVEHLRATDVLTQLIDLNLHYNDMSEHAADVISSAEDLQLTCLRLTQKISDEGLRKLALTDAYPNLLSCSFSAWGDKPSLDVSALVALSPQLAPNIDETECRAVPYGPDRLRGGVTELSKKGLTPLCKALGIKGYSKLKVDALTEVISERLANGGVETLRG